MSDKRHDVTFLGEVLLDLDQSNVTGRVTWYDLETHDENNGDLMYPCRVTQLPSNHKVS